MCLAPARKGKGRGCPRQPRTLGAPKQRRRCARLAEDRPHGRHRRVRRRAGGVQGFPHSHAARHGHGIHPDPAPRPASPEPAGGPAGAAHRHARRASEGWREGCRQPRLHHPAGCNADDREGRAAGQDACAAARASPPDRHLFRLACQGPGRAGRLHRPVGRRQRRHGWAAGDQGQRRAHAGPGRVRRDGDERHADQCRRHGARRSCRCRRGHAGEAYRASGAAEHHQRLEDGPGQQRGLAEASQQDQRSLAQRHRSRLCRLQGEYPDPPRAAAHAGAGAGCRHRLHRAPRDRRARSRSSVPRAAHRRNAVLPRSRSVRCAARDRLSRPSQG